MNILTLDKRHYMAYRDTILASTLVKGDSDFFSMYIGGGEL